ncbi:MAG: cellulose synthase subunit BcsC-related outer membrane protein [Myxococcota bacterium]
MTRPSGLFLATTLSVCLASPIARADTAVEQLLTRAAFLQSKGRTARARAVFEKVLRAVPNHPAALTALGVDAARAGQDADAGRYLQRLQRAHPQHPQIGALEHAIRVGARFGPLIASARQRAQAGRPGEAVVLYRQAFGRARPPPDLALEFYQTLGGTKDGWAEAKKGLERLARRRRDPGTQLAFARHLTYRPLTRREGIRRLNGLASKPGPAKESALTALKDALLWLDAGEADIHLYRGFLNRRQDPEVAARLAKLQPSASRVRAQRVARGFKKLEASDVAGAKALFQKGGRKQRAAGLVGLAAVAMREEAFDEAVRLLLKAKKKAPRRPKLWAEALEAARFWSNMRKAEAARDKNELAAAEKHYTDAAALKRPDRHYALSGLGFLALGRGDREKAQVHFDAALEAFPSSEPALRGLRELHIQSGAFDEAITYNQTLIELEATSALPQGQLQAEKARREAAQARENGRGAIALRQLQKALENSPKHPWVLHDLVDLRLAEGQLSRARESLEALLAVAPDLPEARILHARLEAAVGHPGRALDLLKTLPKGSITPDSARLADQLEIEVKVQAATRRWYAGDRAGSRQALLKLQSEYALEPRHLGAVAQGWTRSGDYDRAISTLHSAIALTERPSPGIQLQLAGVLLQAERFGDLNDLLLRLQSVPFESGREQRDLQAIQVAFAVRVSDLAREAGRYVRAFDQLAPLLAELPEDRALLAALGRVFRSSGRLEDAKEVFARVLARHPRDVDARAGAVETSLALGETEQAALLVDQGLQLDPDEPRMVLVAARYHAQRGQDSEAMQAYGEARLLAERRAMGEAATRVGGPRLASASGNTAPAPAVLQAGYAAFGLGSEDEAPRSDTQLLLQTVAEEERQIRSKYAVEIGGGVTLRQRQGESGLGLLTEVGGYARASVPFGYDVRLLVEAEPVTLDTGLRDLDLERAARFGTLGSVTGTTDRSEDTQIAGAALRVGLRWGGLTAIAGSTPLGFGIETFVGKLRFEDRFGSVGMALEGARESITDSVLSWGGMRDPGSGEIWGGVVRMGGRADLSVSTSAGMYYLFGGGYIYEGTRTAENSSWLGGLGAQWLLHEEERSRVTLGIGGLGMGYAQDLSYFSFGHGGYFSPQLFLRGGLPFRWVASEGAFSWSIDADPGLNWFRTDDVAWFPNDASLQTQRVAVAGTAEPAVYAGRTVLSFSLNAGGELGYAITRELEAGARVDLHFAEDYEEVIGGIFIRYAFADAESSSDRRTRAQEALDRALARGGR